MEKCPKLKRLKFNSLGLLICHVICQSYDNTIFICKKTAWCKFIPLKILILLDYICFCFPIFRLCNNCIIILFFMGILYDLEIFIQLALISLIAASLKYEIEVQVFYHFEYFAYFIYWILTLLSPINVTSFVKLEN